MIDLNSICTMYDTDIESVITWCNDLYDKHFSRYFKDERDLYFKLQSKIRPITDEELEWILISLPLQLFSVAEKVSEFKISQEVIKMKNKQLTAQYINVSQETTQTKKKEESDLKMLENKLVDIIYSTIISRVDREMTFSRELIMSAKKIWDRRRQSENINPINPVDIETTSIDSENHKTFYEQQQLASIKNKQRIY